MAPEAFLWKERGLPTGHWHKKKEEKFLSQCFLIRPTASNTSWILHQLASGRNQGFEGQLFS